MRLGVNLTRLAYFSDPRYLVNSLHLGTPTWEVKEGGSLPADRPAFDPVTGYPIGLGNLPSTGNFCQSWCHLHAHGAYDTGAYTLRFQGTGQVRIRLSASTVGDYTEPDTDHTVSIPYANHNGIRVQIRQSDPDDPIRDIRLVPPGQSVEAVYERPWSPLLVDRCRPFGVLRTMDTQQINGSKVSAWSHRRSPLASQTDANGVAPEFLAALANQTGSAIWICLPHLATLDYCRSFGELLIQQLKPCMAVYLEVSNEVWNGIFAQHHHYRQIGRDNSEPYTLSFARDATAKFNAFLEGFGDRSRVKRVAAWQHTNRGQTRELIQFFEELNPDDGGYDVISTAPYFGHRFSGGATEADLAAFLPGEFDRLFDGVIPGIRNEAQQRLGRPIELAAYECGQHLVGLQYTDLQRSELMRAAYRVYLDRMQADGYDLAVLYTLNGRPHSSGDWGLLDSLADEPRAAAKFGGVLDWLDSQVKPEPEPEPEDPEKPTDPTEPPPVEPEPEPEDPPIEPVPNPSVSWPLGGAVTFGGRTGRLKVVFEPDDEPAA